MLAICLDLFMEPVNKAVPELWGMGVGETGQNFLVNRPFPIAAQPPQQKQLCK